MSRCLTDQPNIQREVIEYVLEHADGAYDVVHLRDSPLSDEYGSRKVAEKVHAAGCFNWGINALHPWYESNADVRTALEAFDD